MKALLASVIFGIGVSAGVNGQGFFRCTNPNAPTHIGSINGPLADADIWGQGLAGLTPDSLAPVGVPAQYYRGYLIGIDTFVPFSRPGFPPSVFVQMAAWDGRVWGLDFTKVPPSQIGYTDIVLVQLDVPPGPLLEPNWTQSVIVPLVPEPAVLPLASLGGALLLFGHCLPGRQLKRAARCRRRGRSA